MCHGAIRPKTLGAARSSINPSPAAALSRREGQAIDRLKWPASLIQPKRLQLLLCCKLLSPLLIAPKPFLHVRNSDLHLHSWLNAAFEGTINGATNERPDTDWPIRCGTPEQRYSPYKADTPSWRRTIGVLKRVPGRHTGKSRRTRQTKRPNSPLSARVNVQLPNAGGTPMPGMMTPGFQGWPTRKWLTAQIDSLTSVPSTPARCRYGNLRRCHPSPHPPPT